MAIATKKLAFLYADTGGGHRASALAVKQEVEARFGSFVAVELLDPTKLSRSPLIRRCDRLYSRCIRRAPWAWAVLFHCTNHRSVVWVLRKTVLRSLTGSLRTLSRETRFDAIVSFHPLLSDAARRVANDTPGTIAMTVVTDLVEPHASWAHTGMDATFVPNRSSATAIARLGVSDKKCHCVGLPVGRHFTERAASPESIIATPRFSVLLVGGGEGTGGLHRKAKLILRRCPNVDVRVIAGRNAPLLSKLHRLSDRYPENLTTAGFVSDMAHWMRSADLVVTKAGPGTIAEALAIGTPLLITGHLRGQERRNPDFVTIGQAGIRARRNRRIIAHIRKCAADTALIDRFEWSARLLARPNAARDIADKVVQFTSDTGIKSDPESIHTNQMMNPHNR